MYNLPNYLQPENRKFFAWYQDQLDLEKLREKVFLYILSGDTRGVSLKKEETGMYEFKTYAKKFIEAIRDECHVLGWKTKLDYGGTLLYIYAEGDKEPYVVNGDILDDFE